jgi:hypothetical protein
MKISSHLLVPLANVTESSTTAQTNDPVSKTLTSKFLLILFFFTLLPRIMQDIKVLMKMPDQSISYLFGLTLATNKNLTVSS